MQKPELRKLYYQKNKIIIIEKVNQWRKENTDYVAFRNSLFFHLNKDTISVYQKNVRPRYKHKMKAYLEKHYLKHPMAKRLKCIKDRCRGLSPKSKKYYLDKGIKNYLTEANLIYLWNRDRGYLMKNPSIDRKDSNGNYKLSNCRFIEMQENRKRAKQGGSNGK